MKFSKIDIAMAVTAIGLALGLATSAQAQTPTAVPAAYPAPTTVYACERPGHVPVQFFSTPPICPVGTRAIKVGQGSTPSTGTGTGAAFVPQPTQLIDLWTEADPALTVPTGGKFCPDPPACSGGSVLAGHLGLPAGTWQVTIAAKASPNSGTPALPLQTFPQFFVYTQAKNAAFAGDQLNIGSGSIDTGAGHDSYYTGTGIITLSAHTELFVYAFGYDSDGGSGSYNMTQLTVAAVSVPATVTPPTV